MSVKIETKIQRSAVEQISRFYDEPTWLTDIRQAAFEAWQTMEWPKWDRTDLRGLDPSGLVPFDADPVEERLPASLKVESSDESLLVQYGSQTAFRSLASELKEKGVVFTSLMEAVKTHEELVREHLFSVIPSTEDRVAALNAAMVSGGVFVYVPRNVKVDLPLHISLFTDQEGLGIFPRVLVVADQSSEVAIVETTSSEGSSQRLVNCMVEVVAKANSRVTYASTQNLDQEAYNLSVRRAHVLRDARVDWVFGEFGSKLTKVMTSSHMMETGSESYSHGVFFGSERQHLDVGIHMQHFGDHSDSDMLTKGALKDRARGVYRGLTDIEDGARETSAYQTENTLLLSKQARADAIPELEIEETEVAASHAATVGQVDELQMFYLMSRGLPEDVALKTLVHGFFESIVRHVPLEAVREEIGALIDRKMS